MKKPSLLIVPIAILLFIAAAEAQRPARTGKVCGDPNLPCKNRGNFQSYELPFDTGRNYAIADSELFYAAIIESRKIKLDENCETAFTEQRRLEVQKMFPKNKVFALKCFEPGLNYYTNVAADVGFLGIYAGRTKAQATSFLKTIQSKFPGAVLRRMRAGINGT
jgi:hypothetical protein